MPDKVSHTALNANRPIVGRFAPSPTGRIHAGNIYAALLAWLIVKSQGGTMVLRIEDLDRERSKAEYIDAVQRDFELLGLEWDRGPYFQHDRDEAYHAAFESLQDEGLLYPCFCTRADLHAASAPHRGEKLVYPGTCRGLSAAERAEKECVRHPAFRLRVPDTTYAFTDAIQGAYRQNLLHECGDFLVKRSDGAFAYQLAVVVDDAEQGITSVTRGVDLLCSTPQQMYLQDLLGLPHPGYAHIPLLVSQAHRRLSKRDHDASIDELLLAHKTPGGVIGLIAGICGLAATTEPVSPQELLKTFDLQHFCDKCEDLIEIPWMGKAEAS